LQSSISPDVKITGSKNFCQWQVELAKKSDELYNSLNENAAYQDVQNSASKEKSEEYIDLSQHAAEERIPRDDLVVLQSKYTLALPLLQNQHFPVTNPDVKNFCAIVELAYMKGVQKYTHFPLAYQ
jgi:hypothetical protein